jgi:hypothetical protein
MGKKAEGPATFIPEYSRLIKLLSEAVFCSEIRSAKIERSDFLRVRDLSRPPILPQRPLTARASPLCRIAE